MKKIRKLRKAKGWTQRELALILGVSQRTISHYELDIQSIPIETLRKLAMIFNTTIDEILK